jgi:hypothetical protein
MNHFVKGLAAATLLAGATLAQAQTAGKTFAVTITNITKGVSFTPVLAATHSDDIAFFEVGTPASEELSIIAEGGNIVPLMDLLLVSDAVADVEATGDLLGPGASVTLEITANRGQPFLSMASMLLPTNDTFFALNGVRVPRRGSATYYASAYDAGSEVNDEDCLNIPGPTCGGEGVSADSTAEGYVYPSPGIHGEGDLPQSAYDWQGAVAKITVTALN